MERTLVWIEGIKYPRALITVQEGKEKEDITGEAGDMNKVGQQYPNHGVNKMKKLQWIISSMLIIEKFAWR